ncbi:hypothetical protein MHBO_002011 [Bonamia ostreae]|uniref:Thymidine kinase n=1 Tax=Bonamia ostreae TaxID=126728 RepID=A0ABV2AKX5_9EUKA
MTIKPKDQLFGHVELILGPMFSGKTTELFRRIRRYTFANLQCYLIKYKNDNRYSSVASTHDKIRLEAVSCTNLGEAEKSSAGYDVIGIDEGQFFPDIVEFCQKMAENGKIVVVSALNGTYQRKPFDVISRLVPISEKMTKLSAICMVCYGEAHFTKRTVSSNKLELIGGSEFYIATCRKCFNLENDKIKNIKSPSMFSE